MSSTFVRAGILVGALVVASTSFALAETSATPAPQKATVAQASPSTEQAAAPAPTPNPLSASGFFRSYYFTRQNATNNPGTQFNFSPGAKYNANGVNQASWNNAVDLHLDYHFPDLAGWYVGGSYFYAQPFNGPCSVAPANAKGKPCVSQAPPNTNPDNTLPGFSLDTFPETYVGYKHAGVSFIGGDFLFNSPWAGPYDATRLKPVAYQGADLGYTWDKAFTFEFADIFQ
ncbi:MAG TPA: hypothetical protein VNG31_06890, partial [Candidatus Baltobacteraceae bacterium]|nr:hypothetical protein [Candidatus Baltobacteraceae bacterium]